MNNVIDSFRAAMADAGLEPPPEIIGDGEVHRFKCNGDSGAPCWYSLHIDESPAGQFGCHKRDLKESWAFTWADTLPPAERQQLREKSERTRKQAEAERREKADEAARQAEKFWRKAKPADPTHPYFAAKKIRPHGVRQFYDDLLLPLFDMDGRLQNLQRITADGRKLYLPDAIKTGNFCPLGEVDPDGRVLLAEGFSTAASIRESVRETVIISFDCGNLLPVARALRKHYPNLKIDFASDNDHQRRDGNIGIQKAIEAAAAVQGEIYFPNFPEDDPGSDFNDIHVAHGLDEVRQQLTTPRNDSEISQVLGVIPAEAADLRKTSSGRALSAADDLRISADFSSNGGKIPLSERKPPLEYPVESLGPILGGAAKAIAWHVQVPVGMAAQSVLAAAALACQQHIDAARGNIGTSPVSLNFITEAGSGERKSTADKLALLEIRAFEAELREQYEADRVEYAAAEAAWKHRRDSIIQASKPQREKSLTRDQQTALKRELETHEKEKPQPPKRPNLIFGEATAEGALKHFVRGYPTAGLFTAEGVEFFSSHGMTAEAKGRSVALYSHLWDGSPLVRTRATEGESALLVGRRLSAHLMMQPAVAAAVLSDPLLLGQGFLARYLIYKGENLAGTRFLAPRDPNENPATDPRLKRYWARIGELIRTPIKTDKHGGLELETLPIEGEALAVWRTLHDGAESLMAPGKPFADIQPFASKGAENAARLAAVMAYIEGEPIGVQHIERAGQLVGFYLELMAQRTEESAQDQVEFDAAELLAWIKERGGKLSAAEFKALPVRFRSVSRCRPLLGLLVHMGHLTVTTTGPRGKPTGWEVVSD